MNSTIIRGIKTYSFDSMDELVEYAFSEKKSLIAINAEKLLHATGQIKNMINRNIGYSDGIGAVWALKKKGFKKTIKIPGVELWLEIISRTYHEKSFYLVGSKPDVIEKTVNKLKTAFPGIKILNYRDGFIKSEEEKESLLEDIKSRKPDVVFVAIGSPRQELLIEQMLSLHPAVYQGLGGSFDVYVGTVQRAPEWWVAHNLEWAYRLVKQPSRIRRQIHLVKFLWLLMINKI